MLTGEINKVFENRGFGFITPDDNSEDVFVHVKECPDLKGKQPGDAVCYSTDYDCHNRKYANLALRAECVA